MFHLLLNACLASDPTICEPRLLPAGDAATKADCMAQGAGVAESWAKGRDDLTTSNWDCVPTGDLPMLTVEELSPGIFTHFGTIAMSGTENRGRIANLSFIARDEVLVIDAGGSRAEGEALYATIRSITDAPIAALVLTHIHPDHSFGAEVFREAGAKILAHARYPEAMAARADTYMQNFPAMIGAAAMAGTRIVMPDRTFDAPTDLPFGGDSVRLAPVATAHTDNDLIVWHDATRSLFAGDLLFRGLTPVVDGSLNGWLGWLERTPRPKPMHIIPGHGPAAGDWVEASAATRAYLIALRGYTRKAIERDQPMSQAVPAVTGLMQSEAKGWTEFPENTARNATAAYKELEWE